MSGKTVLVVLGTRPEAVKLAPVLRALRRHRIRALVCDTAQHRGLLDDTLRPLGIKPDIDLDLMTARQEPEQVAERVLAAVGRVLERRRPAMMIVQGDTTTAAAAAFAGFRAGIPVAHVEAGLRSFDLRNPYPEEGNRILIDQLSDLLFAPTRGARANLLKEKISARKIFVTGNTVIDSLKWAAAQPSAKILTPLLRAAAAQPTVLVTLHRRESFGRPLLSIFSALLRLAKARPGLRLVVPLHPNPNVLGPARRHLRHPGIRLCRPLPYLEFVRLIGACRFVITDSGGLQEEAAALGKPVLVVRDKTERPELIACGAGLLVGRRPARLLEEAGGLLDDEQRYRRMCRAGNPFGDGKAGERIAARIAGRLK